MLAKLGEELGRADMFESAFDMHEYADGEDFEAGGSRVTPMRVLHYEMLAFGFRVSDNGTTLAYYEAASCMRGLVRVAEARLGSTGSSAARRAPC